MLLQAMPPQEALNPEIAYWIIGTLLLTIASMVAFMKWVFTKTGQAGVKVWTKIESLHKEGIQELKEVKETQIAMQAEQQAIKQGIDETKYSVQTLSEKAIEIQTKKKVKESA